jgi:hypothetical protein
MKAKRKCLAKPAKSAKKNCAVFLGVLGGLGETLS